MNIKNKEGKRKKLKKKQLGDVDKKINKWKSYVGIHCKISNLLPTPLRFVFENFLS